MKTRTYADLFDLVQALCGVVFANIEKDRIKALINRRAQKAYRATNYWTRFLRVGEEVLVLEGLILYEDPTSGDDIDTFLRIHKDRPYESESVQEYEFIVNSLGAKIVSGTLNPSSAFATYKIQFNDKFGPNPTAGESQAVPAEWFEYLAHGTYADYLRAEGQQERAALADQEANEILQDELIRLDEQHTQTLISNRIFTNSNMQLRW
jgi:hypothetical protein